MLIDHLGDGKLTFPEGLPARGVAGFLDDWRTNNPAFRLRWMVDHSDREQVLKNHARVERYAELIDQQRAAHRAHLGTPNIPRDTQARGERVAMFNGYVLPVIRRRGPPTDPLKLSQFYQELQELHGPNNAKLFRKAFRAAAPSMETLVQIFARQSQDSARKTERQDFWDAEHASLAFAYADAFVTADGGLNEVLRMGERRPPGARATVLTSVEALTTWLEAASAS